ncbi:uncharacterized protein LOC144067263 isoform X2 [Stigmatopora argus]
MSDKGKKWMTCGMDSLPTKSFPKAWRARTPEDKKMQAAAAAGGQILTDLREELADRPQEPLGQMHVGTAFVLPDALDDKEEEQEGKNGDRLRPDSCLAHVAWMWPWATGRTTKGPTHTPTKLRTAKYFRCLSPPKAGRGTKSTSAGREPASTRR